MSGLTNHYGERVRVRTAYDATRWENAEIVELKDGEHWVEQARYGHMSDDFAFTHSKQHAQSLALKHATFTKVEGEA